MGKSRENEGRPIVLMSSIILTVSKVASLLIFDPLFTFRWQGYFLFGLMYTALVFRGELSKKNALIFSKQNVQPISAVLVTHAAFLSIVCGFINLLSRLEPYLPDWMSNNIGRGSTPYDLLVIVALIILDRVEFRWIYLESGTDTSKTKTKTKTNPSDSSVIKTE